MSFRVYGFKINQKNFLETHEFIKEIQRLIQEKYEELYISTTAKLITEIYDSIDLLDEQTMIDNFGFLNTKISPLFSIDRYLQNIYTMSEDDINYISGYDYSFEVCLYPMENKILATIYTNQEEFIDIWKNHKDVSDFSYSNSSDKPDDISDEEWDERKNSWETMLPNYSIPKHKGFCISLVKPESIFILGASRLQEYIPSLEDRLKRISKMIIESEISKEIYSRETDKNKAFKEYLKYFKSDDYKNKMNEYSEKYKDKLKEDIDYLDLAELRF